MPARAPAHRFWPTLEKSRGARANHHYRPRTHTLFSIAWRQGARPGGCAARRGCAAPLPFPCSWKSARVRAQFALEVAQMPSKSWSRAICLVCCYPDVRSSASFFWPSDLSWPLRHVGVVWVVPPAPLVPIPSRLLSRVRRVWPKALVFLAPPEGSGLALALNCPVVPVAVPKPIPNKGQIVPFVHSPWC